MLWLRWGASRISALVEVGGEQGCLHERKRVHGYLDYTVQNPAPPQQAKGRPAGISRSHEAGILRMVGGTFLKSKKRRQNGRCHVLSYQETHGKRSVAGSEI